MLPPRNAPFQKLLSRNTNTTALHTADYLRCFRPGNRFSKMAPGILNAVFVIFLSFGSLDPLAPILHLPVDLSFLSQAYISIADIMFQTRPNIHADGPNLNFRSHVFRTVREVNRRPDVRVQRPVAVVVGGGWDCDHKKR